MRDPEWHHGDTEYFEKEYDINDRKEFFHLTRDLAASIRYLESVPSFIPDEEQTDALHKLLDYLDSDVQRYFRVSRDR